MPRLLLQCTAIGNFLQEHFPFLIVKGHLQCLSPGVHGKLCPDLPVGNGSPLRLYADTAYALCFPASGARHRLSPVTFRFRLRQKQRNATLLNLPQKGRAHPEAVRTPGCHHHSLSVFPEKQTAVLLLEIL